MSSRCLLVNFHRYTPFGPEFYEPILDYFLKQMEKYSQEYDMIYLLASNWNIDSKKLTGIKAKIIKTDPNMRYFNCYKAVLPQVKEDLVLFLDNDLIVYKEGEIRRAFSLLSGVKQVGEDRDIEVVSITDTIGTMQVPLKTGNKLCPYFFASRKDLLMKYLDVDWSPDAMPYTETFGLLTEALLKDGAKVYEMEDDKSGILFDGSSTKPKDLGYYHIRSGSIPAYLLATKAYGDIETYKKYITEQPKSEYLRQMAWYYYMLLETDNTQIDIGGFLEDVGITLPEWYVYMNAFKKYHGLI